MNDGMGVTKGGNGLQGKSLIKDERQAKWAGNFCTEMLKGEAAQDQKVLEAPRLGDDDPTNKTEEDETIEEMVRRMEREIDKEFKEFVLEYVVDDTIVATAAIPTKAATAATTATDTAGTISASATATGSAGGSSAKAAADATRASKADPPPGHATIGIGDSTITATRNPKWIRGATHRDIH